MSPGDHTSQTRNASPAPHEVGTTSSEDHVWLSFKLQRAGEAFNIINPSHVAIGSDSVRQLWELPLSATIKDELARKMSFIAALNVAAKVLKQQRRDEQRRQAMRNYLYKLESRVLETMKGARGRQDGEGGASVEDLAIEREDRDSVASREIRSGN